MYCYILGKVIMSGLKRKGTSSNDNPNKRAQDASGNVNGNLNLN